VTVRSTGRLRISEPDADADDRSEALVVEDARGVELRLHAEGEAGEVEEQAHLVVENAELLNAIEVVLPTAPGE
jgi:hypothetical protein